MPITRKEMVRMWDSALETLTEGLSLLIIGIGAIIMIPIGIVFIVLVRLVVFAWDHVFPDPPAPKHKRVGK